MKLLFCHKLKIRSCNARAVVPRTPPRIGRAGAPRTPSRTGRAACPHAAAILSFLVCLALNSLAAGYDVAAYVWPAYHNEPRWKELGIFKAGKGEWQSVWEARPKWEGHEQPRRPLWGYENEADPKVVEKKIDAAVSHGVNVFIYDWYWYGGRPFLEDALDKGFLGAPSNGKMKFFIMWANHHVNWLWDNKVEDKKWESPRWRGWVSAEEFKSLTKRWIGKYFRLPNYYRINGKPVLMIYEVGTFVKGVGGVEAAAKALSDFRDDCAKAGLGGVHLMVCDYKLDPAQLKRLGVDSATIYNFVHWSNPEGNPDYAQWAVKGAERFDAAQRELGLPCYFAHASVGWDTNPRYPASCVTPTAMDSTPAKFEASLRRAKAWCDANTPKGFPKLITVNSWNEWTEGSYLEPDKANGFGYLEAIRRVFRPEPFAVQPGENLLANGELEAEQSNVPSFWQGAPESAFSCSPSGGPNGTPSVRIDFGACKGASMRQYGFYLATGGCYRISAFVRTKGLVAEKCGICVPNKGWFDLAMTLGALPRDTHGEWRRLEREQVVSTTSTDGSYYVTVYGDQGVIEVADLRLEAVDETACRKTVLAGVLKSQNLPRLVPMSPLLWRIPSDDPSVEFRFFGKTAESDLRVVVKVRGLAATSSAKLELSRPFRVKLPQGATNGVFTAEVVSAGGEVLFSRDYSFATVPRLNGGASKGVRLNNFVTELVKSPVDGSGEFRFRLDEPTWVFFGVKGDVLSKGFAARLDGKPLIDESTLFHEAFRFLPAGDYRLAVESVRGGTVVVRAVTETFAFQPGVRSRVPENPVYDWNYEKRHGLSSIITENNGIIPPNEIGAFLRRGHRWVPNIRVHGLDEKTLPETLSKYPWLDDDRKGGLSCDEVQFQRPENIDNYTRGLRAFDMAVSPQKPIYTWIIGSPVTPGVDHDFISTCINASRGTARLMSEIYLKAWPTEKEAMDSLRSALVGKINAYRKAFPLSIGSLGVTFGNFVQVPIISLAHYPEVDYKYYLDMQFNVAANDPSCRGLGVIGLWGQYHADDEMRRWSCELLRHYAIEGGTSMLSERHGFVYRPGHLENGDFANGLAGWRTAGSVKVGAHARLGEKLEARWFCSPGVGDSYACLTRSGDEISMLRRTIVGLRPGRFYRLEFFTFDVDNVKAGRIAPRKIEIEATLGHGAEVDSGKSWVHVNKGGRNGGGGQINVHHVVFRATSDSVEISFSDKSAPVGANLGINGIGVLPYFMEDAK